MGVNVIGQEVGDEELFTSKEMAKKAAEDAIRSDKDEEGPRVDELGRKLSWDDDEWRMPGTYWHLFVDKEQTAFYVRQVRVKDGACSWCDEEKDELVVVFGDEGDFHPSCHIGFAKYRKVQEAFDGMTHGEACGYWELVKDTLKN